MTDTEAASPPEGERTAEFRHRVRNRLREEPIVWLSTTDSNGRSHPNPVWFLWEGEDDIEGSTVLVYTEPETAKLRHIAANAGVTLHFDAGPSCRDVVVLYGRAHHDAAAPVATAVPGYVSKYRESVAELGGTDEDFTVDCAVRITIERVRGF